jgi:hypothetical protein
MSDDNTGKIEVAPDSSQLIYLSTSDELNLKDRDGSQPIMVIGDAEMLTEAAMMSSENAQKAKITGKIMDAMSPAMTEHQIEAVNKMKAATVMQFSEHEARIVAHKSMVLLVVSAAPPGADKPAGPIDLELIKAP